MKKRWWYYIAIELSVAVLKYTAIRIKTILKR